MRFLFLLFSFVFAMNASAQYMWQFNKDTVVSWYYFDGDEFNGTQLDRKRWDTQLPWSRALQSQSMYFTDGENLEEKGGVLSISLKKEAYKAQLGPWDLDSNYMRKSNVPFAENGKYTFNYTAGLVWSKQKYKYGYFEIRFKLPKDANGMWPAFWTFGGNKNDEIDFFEIKCEQNNYVHVDVHCPDGCSNYPAVFGTHKDWGGWIKTDKYFHDGYNTIAGEWDQGYVKWYLNGRGIAFFNGKFEAAMNLIANMSQARDDGPFHPGPDEKTKYPAVMDVDYIRVWKKESPAEVLSPFLRPENAGTDNPSPMLVSNNVELKKKKKFLYGRKDYYKNDGAILSLLEEKRGTYLLTLQGNDDIPLAVEILDQNGNSLFKKEDQLNEFLRIEIADIKPGIYTFVASYKGKTIKQQLVVAGRS
ncbi:MAG: family 16 glycosylhydrolase [Bacteroidia bacterium]